MSCPHGNHPDACDICDEVAAAYSSGVEHTKLAQPEQNLACKSTQARLAASWGYVKAQPEQYSDIVSDGGLDPRNKPEQEPVAYMYPADLKKFETNECFAKAFSISVSSPDFGATVPLYASPPKRRPDPYDQTALELCEACGWKAVIPGESCFMCVKQRQPLTDDECLNLQYIDGGFTLLKFARAIEQAHGIGDKT